MNDMFLNNTTPYAHVVFPAASFAEKDGSYTNMERRIQYFKHALKPLANSKTDSEIIALLSNELGYPLDYSTEGIRKEISDLVPIYEGISIHPPEKHTPHGALVTSKGTQWPVSKENIKGTPVLYDNAQNRFNFSAAEKFSPEEKEDTKFPFTLLSGGSLFHSHSGAMTRKSKGLHDVCPEGFLDINPVDAGNFKITENELIRIGSKTGSTTVKIRLNKKMPLGILFAPVHFFEEMRINSLFPWEINPVSKGLTNKSVKVKLEKI